MKKADTSDKVICHLSFVTNVTNIFFLRQSNIRTDISAYDVMEAISNMEPAWETVNGRDFALVEYKDDSPRRDRDTLL